MIRNQEEDAQYLYDERSAGYDESWHPRFARHIVELAQLKSGQYVLDLACGTGLVTFPAGIAVGPEGSVTGIDISTGMLAQAKAKLGNYSLQNLKFYQHSIGNLGTLKTLKAAAFDVIICASALVLLENPAEAIRAWAFYLKSGGRFIVDIPHPNNHVALSTLGRVGNLLGHPLPGYYSSLQGPGDLRDILESSSLRLVDLKLMSQKERKDGRQDLEAYICDLDEPVVENRYTIADVEGLFDSLFTPAYSKFSGALSTEELRANAKTLFSQILVERANAEKSIFEVDGVFVSVSERL